MSIVRMTELVKPCWKKLFWSDVELQCVFLLFHSPLCPLLHPVVDFNLVFLYADFCGSLNFPSLLRLLYLDFDLKKILWVSISRKASILREVVFTDTFTFNQTTFMLSLFTGNCISSSAAKSEKKTWRCEETYIYLELVKWSFKPVFSNMATSGKQMKTSMQRFGTHLSHQLNHNEGEKEE